LNNVYFPIVLVVKKIQSLGVIDKKNAMGMALYKPNHCTLPQAKRSSQGLPKLPNQEQLIKLQE